jgi:hypothetical protein
MQASELLKMLIRQHGGKNGILPPMSKGELEAALQLIDPVAERSRQWCADFSILDERHVLPVALLTIVNHPDWDPERLLSRMKNTLWVFALDDALDDAGRDDDALLRTVADCHLAAAGIRAGGFSDELALVLDHVRHDLEQYPFFERLQGLWIASLMRVLEGMMYERWVQQRLHRTGGVGALPGDEEYMYFARGSIAIPHLWVTSIIIESDPRTLDVLRPLLQLFEECAHAMRLANDLATFERESEEGGINAVAVRVGHLTRGGDGPDRSAIIARAKSDVERQMRKARLRARRLAQSIETSSGIEQGFLRATEFGINLYRVIDFRAWSAAAGALPTSDGW